MSGNFSQTEFKININATAFDLLINKLYKDKPQSIIRELTSNAWDAHIDAGTSSKPVEVTLPTDLTPTLIIKDFGTGLSPKDVQTMYCTLFESNRTRTNEFLGGYGLGCKSPFSYTDQYVVQSRWHNICYTFSVFKNPEGTPTIALIDECKTDEHNGLTITVPVKRTDISAFRVAGYKVLPWFPSISCNIPLEHPISVWGNKHYSLFKTTAWLSGGIYAKIGSVIYPIESHLFKEISNYSYNWKVALVLHVPIGTISIVPSREDLAYDEKTIEIIHEAIAQTKHSLQQEAEKLVLQAPTFNDACRAIKPLRLTLSSFDWWNKTLTHPTEPNTPFGNHITTILPDTKIATIKKTRRVSCPKIDFWKVKPEINTGLDDNITFCLASPKTKNLGKRLALVPTDQVYQCAYLIVSETDVKPLLADVSMGKVNFIDLDTYYVTKQSYPTGVKRAPLVVDDLDGSSITIPDEDNFFYLEGKNNTVILNGKSIQTCQLQNALQTLNYRIHIIPPYKMERITKMPNAINFSVEFAKLLTQVKNNTTLLDNISASINLKHSYYFCCQTQLESKFAKKNPTHPLIQMFRDLKEGHNYFSLNELLTLGGISTTRPVNKTHTAIYERYTDFFHTLNADNILLTALDFYLENRNA